MARTWFRVFAVEGDTRGDGAVMALLFCSAKGCELHPKREICCFYLVHVQVHTLGCSVLLGPCRPLTQVKDDFALG